jgi:hypothetical protein
MSVSVAKYFGLLNIVLGQSRDSTVVEHFPRNPSFHGPQHPGYAVHSLRNIGKQCPVFLLYMYLSCYHVHPRSHGIGYFAIQAYVYPLSLPFDFYS